MNIKILKAFETLRKNWILVVIQIIFIFLMISVFLILPNDQEILKRLLAIGFVGLIYLLLSFYIRKFLDRKEEELKEKIHSETLAMFPNLQIYFDQKQWDKIEELIQSDTMSEDHKERIEEWKFHHLDKLIFNEWQSINMRFSNEKIDEVLGGLNISNRTDAFNVLKNSSIKLTEDELEILNYYYNTH